MKANALIVSCLLLSTTANAQWERNDPQGPRWRVKQPLQIAQIIIDANTVNGDKCTSSRSISSKLCPNLTADTSNGIFEIRGTKNRYVTAALSNISDEYPGLKTDVFVAIGLTLDNSGKGEFSVGAVIELMDRTQVDYHQINLTYQLDFYYQ